MQVRRTRKRGRELQAGLGALLLGSGLALAEPQGEDGPRGYALPQTREAAELYAGARAHAASGRAGEAIAALQELLDRHAAEVLSQSAAAGARSAADEQAGDDGLETAEQVDDDSWRARAFARPRSRRAQPASATYQASVREGVALLVRRELCSFPASARRLYAERFEQRAESALRLAAQRFQRGELVSLARRYPLTRAAVRALLILAELELEAGELPAAQAALEEARALASATGAETDAVALVAALEQRAQSLSAWERAPAPARAEDCKALGQDSQHWSVRIDDGGESNPFNVARGGDTHNLLPAVAEDSVFVSNSLRLRSIELGTGRERWCSPEPPGWKEVDEGKIMVRNQRSGALRPVRRSEFFEAIDRRNCLIAPATDGRVVVAALQVPLTQVGNQNFQNLRITNVIPDRRLFAFDAHSGAPLWNHLPPLLWDGSSGPIERAARVAAPPTLAGSRVLVPLYRVQGRIDYHVACFDLATGARLWATSLISGQIAMNMFNQHSREFCAAPLVVEGQRVIAQTNLGVLAALDLASGEILWQLPIESVPIPRLGHDWMPREREQYWRNAPPIVHGSVVLSAPTDGFDLVAADLATGRPLWSAPQALFLPSERAWPATALRLVGVLEGRIFVAGPVLAFARSSSDLRAVPRADSARGMSAELVADGSFDPNFLAWPALLGRQVVVATPWARVVLDAQDLKNELRALGRDWNEEQGGGNLLASGDWLLSLSNKFVWGAFDWESRERVLRDRLQQLAHSEAKFTDGSVLVDLVNWTLARGENALQQAEPSAALTYAHSARRDLEGPLAQALAPERRTELQGSVEWLSARACAAQADSQAALTHARRALALAATPRERARALVLEAELRRLRNDWPALEGVAAELAQLEFATPLPREGAGRSLGEWRAELELELAGRRGDLTREFELLHELLERAGDVRLRGAEAVFLPASGGPGLEGSRVSERVAELLARGAQARAAHAPIEARAERALAEAMESEDERALERVAERFPHSLAGATALRSRLAQAEAGGDLELVIRLVQRSLAPELAWPSAGEADWEALAALARAAGRAGNLELEAAGERRSQRRGKHDGVGGRTAPGEPDDAGPGRALAQEPRSEFGPELEPLPAYLGEGEVLAGVGAREEQGELLVWIQGRPGEQWVEARFPGAGQQEERTLWRCELPGGFVLDSSAREGRRLILSGGTNLGALDLFTGELRWMLDLAPNQVLRSELRSGVAAALLLTPDGSLALSAFEAVSGLLLWSRPLPGRTLATFAGGPEHVLCFMEEAGVSYLLALDRFAGRRCAQVKLAVRPMEADARGAWIEGSWAFLPSFQRSSAASERARPILRCLDLDAGEETWSLGGDAQRELDAFVRADGRLYAVLRPVSPPAAGEGPQDRGALWEVDLRSGTARELGGAGLGRFEQVLGVPARSVALLEEPFLVLAQVEPRGLRADLRALHLPFGERWRFARSERPRGSTAGSEGPFLPGPSAPAVSSTMVALCVGTEGAEGGAAAIELYERDSGRLKQRLSLPAFLGPSEGIRISGRGRSLIVEGGGQVVVYKSQ